VGVLSCFRRFSEGEFMKVEKNVLKLNTRTIADCLFKLLTNTSKAFKFFNR
jgi:hypothetical protein